MSENGRRLVFLDNLKVFLIVLVLIAHAGFAFTDYGLWPFELTNRNGVFTHFFNYILCVASFAMSLFMFISGYFVSISYEKYGWHLFLKKKLSRLIAPLVAVSLVFSIVSGQIYIGHLWFLQSLFIFCLLYVILRKFCEVLNMHISEDRGTILYLFLIIILIITTCFIRRWYALEQYVRIAKIIYIEPAHYFQYFFMFLGGVMEYKTKYIINKISDMKGKLSFFVGFCMILAILLLGENMSHQWWYSIYESFVCIIFSVGLIWFFEKYVNWDCRLFRWATKQSMGVYIFHLFVLLFLHYVMDYFSFNLYLKYVLICILGIILSFVLTYYLRKIPVVSKII